MKKCIICGNPHTKKLKANFVPFLTERMFNNENKQTSFIYCPVCNFYFSEYRPNEEELGRLYKDYRGEEYQKQRQKFEPAYTEEFNKSLGFSEDVIAFRKYSMMQIIKNFILPENIKTVLDWGGDAGQYIPDEFVNAEKYVYDISGIKTQEGVQLLTSKESLKNRHWDLILCDHVLEHLSDPVSTVNEIISLMDKGSYLYVELPLEKYAEEYRLQGDKKESTFIHEHINLFSTQTLENLFMRPDITILENTINIQGCISCFIKKQSPKDEILILNTLRKKIYQNSEICLDTKDQNSIFKLMLNSILKTIENEKQNKKRYWQQIFSVYNENRHKVWQILGIKTKFKRKSQAPTNVKNNFPNKD